MGDNIDRILSSDQVIIPSSAFVRNVMAAIHREASALAPVPFPRLRLLPGLVICAVALPVLLIIAIAKFQTGALVTAPTPRVFADVVNFAKSIGLGWIVIALVAAFAPARLVFATK